MIEKKINPLFIKEKQNKAKQKKKTHLNRKIIK